VSRRAEHIHAVLDAVFHPVSLEIEDDSARHAGHAGARESGGGHFIVHIAADAFAGKDRIERHRMVNDALKSEFGPMIHALSIRAKAPDEV
jgi:BolA protein